MLRQVAQPLSVEEILKEETRALVEMMAEIMRSAPGVGLAAPQIGISLQVIVIEDCAEYLQRLSPEECEVRGRVPVPFHALVNPRLHVEDTSEETFFEGCLSVPGYLAYVPRARTVRVDALDLAAQPLTIRATGWYGRILQHEIDHLHGVLCVDRMRPRSLTSHDNYERFWRRQNDAEVQAFFAPAPPET